MQITKITLYKMRIPMEPFVIATGTMDYAQNILVKIEVDQPGLYGMGEGSAFPMITGETQETCFAVAKDFAKIWMGKDAEEIEERMAELNEYITHNTTVKCAFDLALFDLLAKQKGWPLYTFLGGHPRRVKTDITVGIASPEKMVRKAKKFVEQGAGTIKIKVGKNADDDLACISSLRKALGSKIKIRIDANQGWTFEEAKEMLQALENYEIEFCEQPMHVRDDAHLPELRKKTRIPIMADESVYNHWDAIRLCENKACDYINIKLAKSGGLLEAQKIHAVASEYGVPCMIGGMLESRLALSANLQLVYSSPGITFFDMDSCLIGHLENPVDGGVLYDHFEMSLHEGTGLCADILPEKLATYPSWSWE